MKELLEEYKRTLESTKKLKRESKSAEEIKIINRIIDELQFIVKWLETGECPQKNRMELGVYASSEEYAIHFEERGSVCFFDPLKRNAFDLIDEKIDRERKIKK